MRSATLGSDSTIRHQGWLDDQLFTDAIRMFQFSRRRDIYFADAALEIREGRHRTSIGSSALGVGRSHVVARCKSELLEQWSVFQWKRSGSPPLLATGLNTGRTQPVDGPITRTRSDATGLCAGQVDQSESAVMHGLLEVLERDTVTAVFDKETGTSSRVTAQMPAAYQQLALRWNGKLHPFTIIRSGLPSTVIVLFISEDRRSGAIGSACRLSEAAACTHACAEALMMYTTARHWERKSEVPDAYRGVTWASRHIEELLTELEDLPKGKPSEIEHEATDLSELARAVEYIFGVEPFVAEMPLPRTKVNDTGVWWVSVPNALSPALVTRDPWPIG